MAHWLCFTGGKEAFLADPPAHRRASASLAVVNGRFGSIRSCGHATMVVDASRGGRAAEFSDVRA